MLQAMSDEFMRQHRGQFIHRPFDAVPPDHDEETLLAASNAWFAQEIGKESRDALAAVHVFGRIAGREAARHASG